MEKDFKKATADGEKASMLFNVKSISRKCTLIACWFRNITVSEPVGDKVQAATSIFFDYK
jgi:hypothetical protein